MYEKDIIPGNFADKQEISLLVGFGFSYLLFNQAQQHDSLKIYLYIIIAFVVAVSLYVAFFVLKDKKIPLENLAEYLKDKRLKMPKRKYWQLLFKMMTKIGAKIQVRKEKGLPSDETLDKVYSILLSEYDIMEIEYNNKKF